MIRPWPYVVVGIVLGALIAGSMLGLEVAAFGWFASVVEARPVGGVAPFGLLSAIIASIAFLIGLTFPGIPIMLALQSSGKTSRRAALLGGALSSSAAGLILSAPAGWYAWTSALWLFLPGAVAGLVLREFAYRPIRPPQPPPPAPPS